MKKAILGLVLAVGVGSTAYAQLHGMGRINGTCTEDGGGPLEGVTVKATLPGSTGSIGGTSDKKGEWMLGGMARGDWDVTFEKAGYVPRKAKVSLTVELARMPPIAVAMKKQ
jgi:carboxypeptidase family protein